MSKIDKMVYAKPKWVKTKFKFFIFENTFEEAPNGKEQSLFRKLIILQIATINL